MNKRGFLACVADPTRYDLLCRLAARPGAGACVGDLVAATGHSQSNVSHHLGRLRDCGFVTFDRDGKQNRYRLANAAIHEFLAAVATTAAALAADGDACMAEACP